MARSYSQASVVARSRSCEAATCAWMVAMAATKAEEAGRDVDEDANEDDLHRLDKSGVMGGEAQRGATGAQLLGPWEVAQGRR